MAVMPFPVFPSVSLILFMRAFPLERAVVMLVLLESKLVRIVLMVVKLPSNQVSDCDSMLRPVKKATLFDVTFPLRRSSGTTANEQAVLSRVLLIVSALIKP